MTDDGRVEYLYDGDGRICAVANYTVPYMTIMTGYLYDAEGRRVAKGTITAWSCDPAVNHFQTTNDYILGLGGEQVTEMGVGGASSGSTTNGLVWQHTNVWAGGKLLATYDAGSSTSGGLHFYFDDPLGTRRVQTDASGNVEQQCSSLPYGDGESCGPTPTEHLFTGKERDAETNNDYFMARYYNSDTGRFLSPDWSAKYDPVPYAKMDDPQTLNLYSYVRNNPLASVDPDGHWGNDLFPNISGMLDPAIAVWQNASNNLINQELDKAKAQQQSSAWKTTGKIMGALKSAFYLKVDVGVGLGAEAKGGPVKVALGVKSVRETNAKFNNQGTVKNVDEASAGIKVGPATFGPSISREQTIQNGNGPTNMNAPDTWHGNLLYDVGHGTAGSNWDVGVGVGVFVGVGGSVEVGVDAQQLYQGIEGAFSNP